MVPIYKLFEFISKYEYPRCTLYQQVNSLPCMCSHVQNVIPGTQVT